MTWRRALLIGSLSIAGTLGMGSGPLAAPPPIPETRLADPLDLGSVVGSADVAVDAAAGAQVSDPVAGTIETFAGGSADGATALRSTFVQPYHAFQASDGSTVVVDTYNNRIRSIEPDGIVRTIAGSGDAGYAGDGGQATNASLNFPLAAALGPDGSLYIADTWNDSVRKVDATTKTISTLAGTGPTDVSFEPCGAGDGGPATSATVCGPSGVAVARNGDVFVTDTRDNRLRRIDAATGTITTVAGNGSPVAGGDGGPAAAAGLPHPWGVVLDDLGNPVVTDDSNRIRYVNLLARPVTVYPRAKVPVAVAPGTIATIAGGNGYPLTGTEGDGGPATQAKIPFVKALSRTAKGDLLLTEDSGAVVDGAYQWTMRVRRIEWRTGTISTIAGNGTIGAGGEKVDPLTSPLSYPAAAFPYGKGIGIVDRGNSRLRFVKGTVETTLAGTGIGDGLPAPQAQIDHPFGVAATGGRVYLSDGTHLRVRQVAAGGSIGTAAGSGPVCVLFGVAHDPLCGTGGDTGDGGAAAQAGFAGSAWGLDASSDGLLAIVVDSRVRIVNESGVPVTLFPESNRPITLAPGAIETAAGGGTQQLTAGQPSDARSVGLKLPRDVAIAPNGDLFVAETGACRIDRVDAATGLISVLSGQSCNQLATFADGPAATARFYAPFGLAAGPDGNVYVADTGNARIRKIDLGLGVVRTVAGVGLHGFAGDGGPALLAEFAFPAAVSFAPGGSMIVTDTYNHRIRRIAPDGTVTTIAGSGPSSVDELCGSSAPCGHYAGDGGRATAARLNFPTDAVVTATGLVLVADKENNRIRAVQLAP